MSKPSKSFNKCQIEESSPNPGRHIMITIFNGTIQHIWQSSFKQCYCANVVMLKLG